MRKQFIRAIAIKGHFLGRIKKEGLINLKNSILTKFMVSFLILIVLIAAQGAVAYITFEKNDELEEMIGKSHALRTFLTEREVDHHLWMISLYDMFAGGPIPEKISSYQECNLGKWYYSTEPDDYYRQYYEELEGPHRELHESSREVVELYRQGNLEEAKALFRAETIPAVNGVREYLHKIEEAENMRLEKLENEMEILDARITTTIIGALIIIFVIAIALAVILTRLIARPISQIAAVSGEIAAGDLTRKVFVNNRDEIGSLADSFNKMIDKLKSLVGSIKEKH